MRVGIQLFVAALALFFFTVVVESALVSNGLCPVHHGLPVNDESEAMAHCHEQKFCNPTGKCIPCKLQAPTKCAKGSNDCGYSYACTIAVTGSRPDIRIKADNL